MDINFKNYFSKEEQEATFNERKRKANALPL